ncbi:MAG: transglycosylase domain-containing protein [Oscillospiraceae bacterium]|nr:transglycosylase domain-containing protein [Oscillospiraceae bacterium]
MRGFFEGVGTWFEEFFTRRGMKRAGRGTLSLFGVVVRFVILLILIAVLTGTFLFTFGIVYITNYLDSDTGIDLEQISLDQTSHIYAQNPKNPKKWRLVNTISGEENRVWVSYDKIPKYIIDAAVAIEDRRFWSHHGVEWKRTFGAAVTLFGGSTEQFGGSSITQQLIKNLTNEKEATVSRKLKEIFRALEFEKRYSKEDILEWYLNTIYLGRGCNGVLTASEAYFSKPLDKLTLAECASIVGITNNPSVYDPFINPQNNEKRQRTILYEMMDQNLITREEYDEAINQKLKFTQGKATTSNKNTSWYEDQAIRDLTSDLMEEYGYSKQVAQQFIYAGGINIYLCVDLNIQSKLDRIWADPKAWPSTPDKEPPESAMMITDPYSGDIKAMIGGREKVGQLLFDRSTLAKRQPGSSLKPVSVYAPAFEKGLITPYSTEVDSHTDILYGRRWPRNSPDRYEGSMSILKSITTSKNTIALKILRKVGVDEAFDFTKNVMGLSTLVDSAKRQDRVFTDKAEAPLAFGGLTDGVTVRDMCGAFNPFPNGGTRYKTRTYSHITRKDGQIIFENKNDPAMVFSELTASYVTSCLESAVTSGTGSRAKIGNMAVAGKTGTTSENKDRWFAGYTPYYVGVCWFGYDNPRDMAYYSSNPAVHMWQKVMASVHKDLDRKGFTFDSVTTAVQSEYCTESSKKPTAACRSADSIATGTYEPGSMPSEVCDLHKMVNICGISGKLAVGGCPAATLQETGYLRPDKAKAKDYCTYNHPEPSLPPVTPKPATPFPIEPTPTPVPIPTQMPPTATPVPLTPPPEDIIDT